MNSFKPLKDWVKDHDNIYSLYKKAKFRNLTSPLRSLPDFLIIGAQKCGTTSLYDFINHHSGAIPAIRKEIFYFSNDYELGTWWYRTHFPLIPQKNFLKKKLGHKVITGEACTAYIFYPLAIKRIKEIIPKAKFIAILRNPVDRAYSHYHHEVKRKAENLSFEQAISEENKRIEDEQNVNSVETNLKKSHFEHHSYLHRGHYAEQLQRWFELFPKEQFLIITLEDLSIFQKKTMNTIFDFLGLPGYELKKVNNLNVGNYLKMKPTTRKLLIDYFKPHNERLYSILNRNFDWDK